MKRIFALLLCLALVFTGCSAPAASNSSKPTAKPKETLSVQFSGLDDADLLDYVKDTVYADTVKALNSGEYVVEAVQTRYLSEEYLKETAYNSEANCYFGYTLEELDNCFQGKRYVFTLGDDGTTTVRELKEIKDTDGQQILKNVAVGTGVILVCVTVSAVAPAVGAPAALTVIFDASAKSAAIFAASSGAFSAAAAGVVKTYQTGDVKEGLKEAALVGSEEFKCGAIIGAVSGGAAELFGLKYGTKGGLKMNEVATIQKESDYPIEVISKLNSMDQYNICREAGLKATNVNGKTALARSVDLDYVDELTGKTNLQRMLEGLSPLDSNGMPYELHHVGQKENSYLAILTREEHRGKETDKIWHLLTTESDNPSSLPGWSKIRSDFWKDYARLAVNGGI